MNRSNYFFLLILSLFSLGGCQKTYQIWSPPLTEVDKKMDREMSEVEGGPEVESKNEQEKFKARHDEELSSQ